MENAEIVSTGLRIESGKQSHQCKGYSLHIGLNIADPNHYPGMPVLKAAVNDALFWETFAKKEGYEAKALHNEAATVKAVKEELNKYARLMTPGDILLLTYAGHGGSIRNDKPNGFDDEKNDQTWCLYDRQMLDDELYECFEAFAEGTRILVVSDSCHSGTIVKVADLDFSQLLAKGMAEAAKSRGYGSRMLPKEVQEEIQYQSGETVYKPIQDTYKTKHQAGNVKASVKLLAACQDDEETLDGVKNGIFTEAFIDILSKEETRHATAEMLIAQVSSKYFFPKPNFFEYGSILTSFDKSFPFSIQIPDAAKVKGYRKPDMRASVKRGMAAPIIEQWDTMTQKVPAELMVEVEGGINGDWTAGKEMKVLNKKKKGNREMVTLQLPGIAQEFAWSAAHAIQTELTGQGYNAIVEPVLTVTPAQKPQLSREGDSSNPGYIKEWPPSLQQGTVGIGWHLDETHSQLQKAHNFLQEKKPDATVRIGHFDTGYIDGHAALPKNLNKAKARSFVDEDPNQAIDKTESGQDGHGLGTMTLLAGNQVKKTDTFGEFEGFIGGAPLAEVIPIRISESVVIMNTDNFCEAIDYAIENKCEVISMSMAGKPSKRMARAVNDAYEAGIVLVTAASNCWYKGPGALLPKCVMFPAAFERVIAATGAMYDHQPYDVNFLQQQRFNITTKYMQGSWGPASRMTRALAAYTPNTPWATASIPFVRSGGGTSSATPQVAAAAALYIACHRDELMQKGYYEPGQQWKKVEAVRHALFTSAARENVFSEWKKYYGNGILRAYDALQVGVADAAQLTKAPEAESSFWGITETLGSFFKNRRLFRSSGLQPAEEALAMELLHLLQTDPQFYDLFAILDLSDKAAVEAMVNNEAFKQKVQQSPYASNYLKEAMK